MGKTKSNKTITKHFLFFKVFFYHRKPTISPQSLKNSQIFSSSISYATFPMNSFVQPSGFSRRSWGKIRVKLWQFRVKIRPSLYLGKKSWLSCDSSGLKSYPLYTLGKKSGLRCGSFGTSCVMSGVHKVRIKLWHVWGKVWIIEKCSASLPLGFLVSSQVLWEKRVRFYHLWIAGSFESMLCHVRMLTWWNGDDCSRSE